jgi:hypothetical protein
VLRELKIGPLLGRGSYGRYARRWQLCLCSCGSGLCYDARHMSCVW